MRVKERERVSEREIQRERKRVRVREREIEKYKTLHLFEARAEALLKTEKVESLRSNANELFH